MKNSDRSLSSGSPLIFDGSEIARPSQPISSNAIYRPLCRPMTWRLAISNGLEQFNIVALVLAWWPLEPIVEAIGRHAQYLAHCSCGSDVSILGDKAVLHLGFGSEVAERLLAAGEGTSALWSTIRTRDERSFESAQMLKNREFPRQR
jgi:hypothetical protein